MSKFENSLLRYQYYQKQQSRYPARKLITFISPQRVHISSYWSTPHNQVGADQVSFVGHSPGSIMSFLQPTIFIPLTHGKGHATSLSSAVVVTVSETPASETPDVCTPKVNVDLNMS